MIDGLTPKHSANGLPALPAGALISKMSIRSRQGAHTWKSLARITAGSEAAEKSLARMAAGSEAAESPVAESEVVEAGAEEFEAAEARKLASRTVKREGLRREKSFPNSICAPRRPRGELPSRVRGHRRRESHRQNDLQRVGWCGS